MAAIVFEDFSTTDGGWSVDGDGRDFAHVPQSGTTGGYITADDGVQGVTWYYTGGSPFFPDLSLERTRPNSRPNAVHADAFRLL